MSNMIIEFISGVNNAKQNARGGVYNEFLVTYKNKSFQDKIETKKLLDFAAKDVYNVLQNASFGNVFEIQREKDASGYWQWTGIVTDTESTGAFTPQPQGNPMKPATTSTPTPKSTYETPEERAARQLIIVRQSSISNAIAALKTDKIQLNADDIIALAIKFENFVMGKEVGFNNFEEDDIPL